jgi:hypothetical protein
MSISEKFIGWPLYSLCSIGKVGKGRKPDWRTLREVLRTLAGAPVYLLLTPPYASGWSWASNRRWADGRLEMGR